MQVNPFRFSTGLRPRSSLPNVIDRAIHKRLDWSAVCRGGKPQEEFQPMVEYQGRFKDFCLDVLGVTLWQGQIDIAEALEHNPRVSVAACYASGKTFTAACLVLYHLFTRRPALVVTTAPTGRQVKTVLWREVRKLYKKSRKRLGGRLLQVKLELSDDWQAFGFSSDSANSVAGLHEGANVLFIEDEAAGMETHIVEGFEGITASSDSRHLKIGNPISESGPFFESHMNPEERKRWVCINIDAEDTPNVQAGRKIFPGLVERDWVEDKRRRWLDRGILGLWQNRVKGQFFVSAAEKVTPGAWTIAAQARWESADTDGEIVLGVDVGGGGKDPSVAYLREGQRARFLREWSTEDLMSQAETIVKLAVETAANRIVIDRTGLGQGVWSRVMQIQAEGRDYGDDRPTLSDDVQVIGVALNVAPKDAKTFQTRACEVAFYLRDALDPNQKIQLAIDPTDTQLAEELGYREWRKNEKGKIQVDSKRELRRKGLGSPDRANALEFCCVPGSRLAVH